MTSSEPTARECLGRDCPNIPQSLRIVRANLLYNDAEPQHAVFSSIVAQCARVEGCVSEKSEDDELAHKATLPEDAARRSFFDQKRFPVTDDTPGAFY